MSTCKRMWTDRQVRSMAVDSVEEKEDLKVFENIVDKDGHKRFIEGNGTPTAVEDNETPTAVEGVTFNYAKWSLSGSHLMVVCDIKITAETVLSNNSISVDFTPPKWVLDKLYPSINPYLDAKKIDVRTAGYVVSGSYLDCYCYINDETDIRISNLAHTAGEADEYVRIEFDFLVDNE